MLTETGRRNLLGSYRTLPPFPEVEAGLEAARHAGFRLLAFSNGLASDMESLLGHAGIRNYFLDIVTADAVRSLKPDPEVYRQFMKRAGSHAKNRWLISSNTFDLTGASATGMQTIWLKRSATALFDPWEFQPKAIVGDLSEVNGVVKA